MIFPPVFRLAVVYTDPGDDLYRPCYGIKLGSLPAEKEATRGGYDARA